MAKATFAAGCFWGVEATFRQLPGVTSTRVGYTGGKTVNPTYKEVCTNRTGHAEAVQILFDPQKLKYDDILLQFFKMHDPTTLDSQGNDRGTQYRSAIFYMNEEQKKSAETIRARVDKSGAWGRPVVTEIAPFTTFVRAEDYHQKYLENEPGGYTCHFMRKMEF